MKTMKMVLWVLVLIFGSATMAMAAPGIREDNSGLLVWIFLAVCALIVLVQMIPVVLMAFGMVRGLTEGEKEPELAKSYEQQAAKR